MPERVGLSSGNGTLCLGIDGLLAPGSDQYSGLPLCRIGAAFDLPLVSTPEDSALLCPPELMRLRPSASGNPTLLGVSEACAQPDGEDRAISSGGSRVFCLII